MCPRDVSTLDFSDPLEAEIAWTLVQEPINYGLLRDEACLQTDAGSSNTDDPAARFDWLVEAWRGTDEVWSGRRSLAESVFGIDAACIEQVRLRFPPDAKWWVVRDAVAGSALTSRGRGGGPARILLLFGKNMEA